MTRFGLRLPGGLGRRTSLGIVDQVISSATNFALNILVVSSVSTDAYGAFAFAYALYIIFRGAVQALISQPLLVRHTEHLTDSPGIHDPSSRRTYQHALGGGLVISVLGSVAIALGALVTSGELRTSLLALAVVLPGLTLQEVMRAVYFAEGRPLGAVAIDTAWAFAQFALVGALLASDTDQVAWLIVAWGVSGTLSVAVAMAVDRLWIRLRGSIRWLLDLKGLSVPFFGEIMTSLILAQGVLIVLTSTSGLEAVGVFRSAQILFSPLNVLLMALTMVGIPEGIRLARARPSRFRSTIVSSTAALTLAVAVWCGAVIAIPPSWGERLLGDSWAAASSLLGVASIYYIGSAAALGPLIGLRTLEAARASFWARSIGSIAGFALGSLGAWLQGAEGAFLGLGVGAVITAAFLGVAFRVEVRATGSSLAGSEAPAKVAPMASRRPPGRW